MLARGSVWGWEQWWVWRLALLQAIEKAVELEVLVAKLLELGGEGEWEGLSVVLPIG